jgi:hypothetical protein
MWLQQTLQLHARSAYPSAVEAERAFAEITSAVGPRRFGAKAPSAVVRPPRMRWAV